MRIHSFSYDLYDFWPTAALITCSAFSCYCRIFLLDLPRQTNWNYIFILVVDDFGLKYSTKVRSSGIRLSNETIKSPGDTQCAHCLMFQFKIDQLDRASNRTNVWNTFSLSFHLFMGFTIFHCSFTWIIWCAQRNKKSDEKTPERKEFHKTIIIEWQFIRN